ncbi:hypothetical protein [Limnoglobus roseus]|nr:hypothetical protein [Limnoglobus roseus]
MAKKPENKKPNRAGKAINVWVSEEVADALDSFIAAQRFPPKKTDIVESCLIEFLKREGFLDADGNPIAE